MVAEALAGVAAPVFTGQAGIYGLQLSEYGLLLRADHMHERAGTLAAWIWVEQHGKPLFMERVSLVSGTAKRTFAGTLERLTGLPNARAVVEDFCQAVVLDYERGEPLVQVSEMGEAKPVEYIIRPWIVAGICSTWFGHGGAGKTTFLSWLGTLATGHPVGDQGVHVEGPCNVAYLDYEGNQDMAQRTLNALYRQYFEGLSPVYYRRGGRSLSADAEELRRLGMERDIGWWIVDSALGALQDDSNSGDPVARCFTVARSLCRVDGSPAAVSFIAHEQKPGKDDAKLTKTPLGSGQWWNQARDVFHVVGSLEPDKSLQVGLFHQKSNVRRTLLPQSYRIQFQSDENDALQKVVVSRSDITMTPDLADRLPMWRRVEAALKAGALSFSELAEDLGCADDKAQDALRTVLHRYRGRYFIQREDKTWGLLVRQENKVT